jgi:hypothetical protein
MNELLLSLYLTTSKWGFKAWIAVIVLCFIALGLIVTAVESVESAMMTPKQKVERAKQEALEAKQEAKIQALERKQEAQRAAIEAKQKALEDRELNVNVMSREAVRARLRDPDSAVFGDVVVVTKNNVTVACGSVNSRNGFGGMGGFESFVSNGTVAGTFFRSDVRDFHNIWNKLCVKK